MRVSDYFQRPLFCLAEMGYDEHRFVIASGAPVRLWREAIP